MFSAFHSLHIHPDEYIQNWQEWLKQQVFDHPAWCTRADRRETELNPKLFIRVGAYSGKGIPPVELLQGAGKLAEFLKITKSNNLSIAPGSKGKQKIIIPMVAITAYIRAKDDDSLEEEKQFKARLTTSELLHPTNPTNSYPTRKRSTEEMSPKQQSTVSTRDLKKSRSVGGLLDQFRAFTPDLEIKLEPNIKLESETKLESGIVLQLSSTSNSSIRTQVQAENEYVEEETEKDTSESDLTSDPDT